MKPDWARASREVPERKPKNLEMESARRQPADGRQLPAAQVREAIDKLKDKFALLVIEPHASEPAAVALFPFDREAHLLRVVHQRMRFSDAD